MPVHFHREQTSYQIRQKNNLKSWIRETILSEKKEESDINIILCSDDYLLEVNREYLQHDYYTDIITFDYVEGLLISGDLFISIDRIKENAKKENVPCETELRRVIIHGLLHLAGYKDKKKEDIKIIREKENFYLDMYKSMFHVEHKL